MNDARLNEVLVTIADASRSVDEIFADVCKVYEKAGVK